MKHINFYLFKKSTQWIILCLLQFLLMILGVMFYSYQTSQLVLYPLIYLQIYHIPLIFYLILYSLISGTIFFLFLQYILKLYYQGIDQVLVSVTKGIPLLEEVTYPSERYQLLIQELTELAAHIYELTQTLQQVQHHPSHVAKQEILTQERQRLARELHDSVSQQLFASSMLLAATESVVDETKQHQDLLDPVMIDGQLKAIQQMIDGAQQELRALLLHLRPLNLQKKSLKAGLDQLMQELDSKVSMTFSWQTDEVSLSHVVEDHLFRIVQEVLSNVLRHAQASHFELYLYDHLNYVSLKMIDNGKGFDLQDEKLASYGLKSIQERTQDIGAQMKIISFPNQGTRIDIQIPKNNL